MRTLICLLFAEETVKRSKARKHVQVASCCRCWAVPIGALLVVLHRVCLSHVSGWLRLVEVFAVVPLGVFPFYLSGAPDQCFRSEVCTHVRCLTSGVACAFW